MLGSATCADCVVTHILSPARREVLDRSVPGGSVPGGSVPGGSVIEFNDDELRVVELLAAAGLVPTLRHREAR